MFEHPLHPEIPLPPDVVEIERHLSRRLDDVLEAEQRAAAIAIRRASSLRDRLLDAEDRRASATVWGEDAAPVTGMVMVGVDHVCVEGEEGIVLVPFDRIVRVVIR